MSHKDNFLSHAMPHWHAAGIPVACILLSFLLSGCLATTSTPQQLAVAAQRTDEQAGWARVSKLSKSECSVTPAPPAREQAVSQSNCVTELVQKHVMPLSSFPDLVKESRKDALRLAKLYEAGQLTPAEYQEESQSRMRKYREEWQERSAAQKDLQKDAKPANN